MANLALVFDILGKDKGSQPLKNVARQADKTGRSLKGVADEGEKTGKRVKGGLGVAGVAVSKLAIPVAALFGGAKLGTGLVTAASNLNETINKSNTIFGKSAGSIRKWAQNAETSLGLTDQQALEAAASFGDMFTQIGYSSKASADMSKKVVQMSADLGSFNNLPTADVQERIAAAFRGEYDSLQKVIPNINAARVEQVALATTGKESAKQLTAQEKAAAVLAIVQKDGARATGDFARTQGEVANQSKIAKAQLMGMAAELGTLLLPVVKRIFGFLTGTALPALSKFVSGLKGVGDGAGPAAAIMNSQFGPALKGIISAGQRLGAVVLPIIRQIAAEFVKRWPQIKPVVMEIFRTIGGIVKDYMGFIKVMIERVTTVIQFIWSRWGDRITAFISSDFQTILKVISGVLKVIGGVVKVFTGIMTGDWRKAGEGIKTIVRGLRTALVAIFDNIGLRIKTGVKSLMDNLKTKFENGVTAIGKAWDGLKAKVKEPIKFVINTVLENGILAAFRKIGGLVGLDTSGYHVSVPRGFRTGGYTGDGDPRKAAGLVHRKEYVFDEETVRKAGGPAVFDRFRNAVRSGGDIGLPGYAAGGFVKALSWAQQQAGKPYGFGSVGPGSYDCSGLMSAIQNVIEGKNPHSRRYSTEEFSGGPFRKAGLIRGMPSAFRIGVWPNGNGVGHMAGTLLGQHVESAGGVGVRVGRSARGADDGLFDYRYGLASGAALAGAVGELGAFLKSGFNSIADWFKDLVTKPLARLKEITDTPVGRMAGGMARSLSSGMLDKVKVFDTGHGYLDKGYNLAYNGTGRREWLNSGPTGTVELGPRSIAAIASALTVEVDGRTLARAVRYQTVRGTT